MVLEDIKTYLKIDGIEEDGYLQDLLDISLIYIDSMVSESYKIEPKAIKLAELLQRKLIADMHSNRGTEIESGSKRDKIVVSILDKLSGYEVII